MNKTKFFFYLRSILNSLFIKSKRNIFFYDQGLISFNEISLVKYISENYKNYQIYFYTNRKTEAKKILPDSVKIISNKFGWLYQFVSKYVFVEQNCHRWICKRNRHQFMIQLWHGLPVKKVGYLNNNQRILPYKNLYSHVFAPSDYGWLIMKECFGYLDEQKLILGSPRNDDLYISNELKTIVSKYFSNKFVLWMPTFRNNCYSVSASKKIFPLVDEKNIFELDSLLENSGVRLIIKLHSLNQKYLWFGEKFKNILFITNDDLTKHNISVYNLIGASRALITDYSSVAIDYICIDKPLIFTVDDIEEFSNNRGLLRTYDLIKITGEKVSDIYELTEAINHLDTNDFKHSLERNKVAKIINKYCDSENCKRVCEMFLDEKNKI